MGQSVRETILTFIELTGFSGIASLIAFSFTRKRIFGIVGQSLVICSLALISIALIHTTKYMIGLAAGLSALYQTFAMIRGHVQTSRASRSSEKSVVEQESA